MKKYLTIIMLVLVLSLSACGKPSTNPEVTEYTLTLTSNISSITPTYVLGSVVDNKQSYTITAPEETGYTFEYWHVPSTNQVLGFDAVFTYTPSGDTTLEAVYLIEEVIIGDFNITATANITSATITVSDSLTNNGAKQFELTAPVVPGYTFLKWIDLSDSSIVSLTNVYNFVATENRALQAFYIATIEATGPSLSYEANFDDGNKQAYAEAIVSLSGENWILSDALINPAAGDKEVSGKSVRIRDGYISTEFTVSNVAQVIFWAATYGADANNTIRFEISVDKTNWVVVDTFTTTDEIIKHSYVFDDAMFTSLSLSSDGAYYFRIISPGTPRTNIDDFQIYTGEGEVVDTTPLYTISFTDDMEYSYLIDETVDLSECVATHSINGPTTCDVIGTVDNTVAGIYEVTFFKIDENNRVTFENKNIIIIDDTIDYLVWDLDDYYDDAEGLFGSTLFDVLHTIVNTGFTGVTYGEARYILDESDVDPDNSSNLILVYTRESVNGSWDGGNTWNREHVWPQSLLGVSADNGTVNSASDLYNLMPANPGENSSRSNQPYSEMGLGYDPDDDVKGDVARALFYMMVMYDELNLVNRAPNTYEMAYLNELLQWHIDDPVDAFELNRLEVIYSYQSNRNPFVDYPHLVELLWFQE